MPLEKYGSVSGCCITPAEQAPDRAHYVAAGKKLMHQLLTPQIPLCLECALRETVLQASTPLQAAPQTLLRQGRAAVLRLPCFPAALQPRAHRGSRVLSLSYALAWMELRCCLNLAYALAGLAKMMALSRQRMHKSPF